MTNKNVESLLYAYPTIPSIINDLERQIREINDECESIYGNVPSLKLGDGIRESGISDPTYNKCERIMLEYGRRKDCVYADIERYKKIQETIKKTLIGLTKESVVIEYRYFKALPWESVARQTKLNKRTCFRYRDKVVEIIKREMISN